jgi:RND family efflux transporter MFP subunit
MISAKGIDTRAHLLICPTERSADRRFCWRLILSAPFAVFGAAFAACLALLPVVAAADQLPAVRSITVEAPPSQMTRQFFGQVRARETVDLSFDVGGTMVRLIPEEGTNVAKGDLLAELDLDPFNRAVERADLSLEMATREAARTETLATRQAGAAARAEDAITSRDMAEVELREARAALADATLRAPFDGLVAVRLTPAFSAVSPGQPVLRLHDMSELRVDFALPERIFQMIGQLDGVDFAALLPGGDPMPLRLVAFQPDTSQVGQSYRVTLAFDNPPASLLPGASVTVTAAVPVAVQAVAVPATALTADAARRAFVMVMEPDEGAYILRAQEVTVLSETGAGLAVTGLEPGTEIVAAGTHLLQDGQRVRRFTGLTVTEE